MSFSRTLAIAGAFAFAAAAAQAATINTAQLFVDPNFSGGTGPNDQTVSQEGLIVLDGSATGGAGASGSGHVEVDDGYVKMNGGAFVSLNTVARGIFRDDVPIVAAVPNGTLVDLTFQLSLSGSLQPGADGSEASYKLSVDFGGGSFDLSKSAHSFSPGHLDPDFVGDPFGLYTVTVTLQAGSLAPLDVELEGSAQAGCVAPGSCGDAQFFLDHSLYWAGITSVTRHDNGAPITDFTAIGTSGVNWAQSFVPTAAVPAPATLLLFGLGLAGIGVAHRRAR